MPIKILIVEDEPEICYFFRDVLKAKYNVQACTSGPEALKHIGAHYFDVIITDLKMPGTSGLDILQQAKAKDEYCEVLIITGYATLESAAQAINLGASSYLMKPVNLSDFNTQVDKAVAQRQFHKKSLELLAQLPAEEQEYRTHLQEIKNLFDFSQKIARAGEPEQMIKLLLREVLEKTLGFAAGLLVDHQHERRFFVSGVHEAILKQQAQAFLQESVIQWNKLVQFRQLQTEAIPLLVLEGTFKKAKFSINQEMLSAPLISLGQTLALLCVVGKFDEARKPVLARYLNLLSNQTAQVLYNGYAHLQDKLLAKTDGLTGALNHRSFHEHLDREINRAVRQKQPLTLALLDIDDFKQVNDKFGHPTGDAVLKQLTRTIGGTVQTMDIFARYGGEEFAVIMPQVELKGAKTAAERIRQTVAESIFTDVAGQGISLTISIGLNHYNGQGKLQKNELIKGADEALYQAKEKGKNRLEFYQDKL